MIECYEDDKILLRKALPFVECLCTCTQVERNVSLRPSFFVEVFCDVIRGYIVFLRVWLVLNRCERTWRFQ